MVLHDLSCIRCGAELRDVVVDAQNLPKCPCGGPTEIRYDLSDRHPTMASVHPKERAVVFRHPVTGKIAYPARNDAPLGRYGERGFERVELDSLHKLDTFCRETGTVNEKAHFNSGNGMDDQVPED